MGGDNFGAIIELVGKWFFPVVIGWFILSIIVAASAYLYGKSR